MRKLNKIILAGLATILVSCSSEQSSTGATTEPSTSPVALTEEQKDALNKDYAAKLGITEKEAEYLWSEHVSTSNTYSEKADSIDILYSDGTIRDISNASEILDLKALTRKPIKRYLFKYRLDPINGTL